MKKFSCELNKEKIVTVHKKNGLAIKQKVPCELLTFHSTVPQRLST